MKKKVISISTFLACSLTFADVYVVRPGDTASDILFRNVEGRIYGRDGNLSKLLKHNPNIVDPDNIVVGETLRFPKEFTLLSEKVKPEQQSPLKVKEKTNKKAQPQSAPQSLFFGLELGSMSLSATESATGENEVATSDLAYGATFKWVHNWSEKYNFFLNGSISKYKFQVSEGKSLEEENLTKAYAGVGLNHKYSNKSKFEVEAGLSEALLLTSNSTTEIEVEKFVVPKLTVSGTHTIARFTSGYGLNASWGAGAFLPSSQPSYDTELTSFWKFGASSFYEQNGKRFSVSLSYGQESIETDNIEQTNKEIAISARTGVEF
ncbi:MAG: hypothetical protein CME64_08555 [Halobacteriovoraceae bacterium]|nr:hypothetical protein [Halobacteriovoraceae bacterium]|tara:strand:+ start:249653 stop:250615 length:963 start_codon:yes stop_codon:yes gene_type:complete